MRRTGNTVAIVAGAFALGVTALAIASTASFGHARVSLPVYAICVASLAAGFGAVLRNRVCSALCAVLTPLAVIAVFWLADVHGDDYYQSGKGEPSPEGVAMALEALLLLLPAFATFILGILGAALRRR